MMRALFPLGRGGRLRPAGGALAAIGLTLAVDLGAQGGAWLDAPLTNWNAAGTALPRGMAGADDLRDARERCQIAPPATAAERALAAAGWMPQRYLDRELVKGDVEILAGMSSLDDMCRPMEFNLFVFAGGGFAGTLSPTLMSSRTDGSAGAVRFVGDEISAEFARYKPDDALCCPSARVTVRYRVERSSAGASVAPTDVRTTRSF